MKIIPTDNFIKMAATRKPKGFKVTREFDCFKAFVGNEQVGQAFVKQTRPGEFILEAIDIYDRSNEGGPNFQRKGYGTALMQAIKQYLRAIGATQLHSSNEGSGTVQMLDRVFGRDKVQHRHGNRPVTYEEARRVMDVDYGYTGSTAYLKGKVPPPGDEQ